MANETAVNDENKVFMEQLGSASRRNSGEAVEQEWDLCLRILGEAQRRANEILGKSRVSNQAKAEMDQVWTKVLEDIGELRRSQGKKLMHPLLEKEIMETLCRRGIESADDWREYIKTMEQDGDVMTEICELLDTDVSQVKRAVMALLEQRKSIFFQGSVSQPTVPNEGGGSNNPIPDDASDGSGVCDCKHANTGISKCVYGVRRDPGVFKGLKHENFEEFVRRFKRKYEVIGCDATLLEILGDDHLGGRAKNIFMALPRVTKERGLDVVIGEMTRLLSQESTAGRMRALTELRSLRMRSGQEANPDCTIEDRSLEYAQILLDNLSDWPEHFQLVGALHRVDPRKAYEEVKQLALSIEQSKVMFGVGRRSSVDQWRRRATQYRNCQEISIAKEDTFSHKGEEYMTGKMDRAEEMYGRDNYHEDLNFGSEAKDKCSTSRLGLR
ncbi:hypothetical protein OSTOST_02871 [Ostertagia ostertagi]